jgi:hypothetical protein
MGPANGLLSPLLPQLQHQISSVSVDLYRGFRAPDTILVYIFPRLSITLRFP